MSYFKICVLFYCLIVAADCQIDCLIPPHIEEEEMCCKSLPLVSTDIINSCTAQTRLLYPDVDDLTFDCYNAECIYNAIGVVKDKRTSINRSKLYIKTKFLEQPGWDSVIDKVVDRCMGNTSIKPEVLKKKMSASPYNLKECNPIFYYYTSCLSINLMIECPDAYNSKSEMCTTVVEYLKVCPLQYLAIDIEMNDK